MIDTHTHLGVIPMAPDETLALAAEAGVHTVIDVGMGVADSRAVVERAKQHPGRVYASVGLHPNDLADFRDDPDRAMTNIRSLTDETIVVAVGETGLDFYRDREGRSVQVAAFSAHIALAKDTGRTLVIHTRASSDLDAHRAVLDILDGDGPPERVVLHCFSGDRSLAEAAAGRGYYCSFAGNLTYKRNDELRDAARAVPDHLLLVETDAPYLAPVPFRGKDNHPALVVHTARVLEEIVGRPVDLAGNARRAFALGDPAARG